MCETKNANAEGVIHRQMYWTESRFQRLLGAILFLGDAQAGLIPRLWC
jgi:hypothetical protein